MDFTDLVRMYGDSDSEIARALGTTRQLVRHWRQNGISRQRQAWIQLRTRGKLRSELTADPKARP